MSRNDAFRILPRRCSCAAGQAPGIARHDLLNEALPYMVAYPDTGIAQTPQFFRIVDDQTWVERGGRKLRYIPVARR